MLLMGLRTGFKGRRCGVVLALLIACEMASAATNNENASQPAPTVRLSASSLGYIAPSTAYLSYRYALTSLDFIDNGHLLFTFHAHSLMRRIPGDDVNDNDQVIHAEVVDIASGKVMKQADWRMHDRQRYLWPLNDGRFLVRQRDSLFLTDSKLELQPYLTFDNRLEALEISPDRKLMLIEVEKDTPVEPSATSSGSSGAPSLISPGGSAGMVAPQKKHTELILVRAGEKTVIARSEATHIVDMPLTDDGFIETEEGKLPRQFVLRKTYFSTTMKPKEFGMLSSACAPTLQALSETVVLAIHCTRGRLLGNPIATAVSTEEGTLWSSEWQDKYIWPSFGYSTDGSRFVYEALEMQHPTGELDSFGEEDVKGQPVGVFDTESGKLELVLNATPVLTGGRNYALSADGRRFAILRDGAIEVYDLPPVPAVVKREKKK
jgi:hypothetical protein